MITCDAKTLSKALQQVKGAVERKSTIPILQSILVESGKNGVTISATNLETYARVTVEASTNGKVKGTIPHGKLVEIVKKLQGDVKLSHDANTERWTLANSNGAEFDLIGMKTDSYPVFPEKKFSTIATVNGKRFAQHLRRTLYAVSNDQSRYNITGVALFPSGQCIAATDGHRLAISGPLPPTIDGVLLIPKEAAAMLEKLLAKYDEDVTIATDKEKHVQFKWVNTEIVTRVVEAKFPSIHTVLPKDCPFSCVLDADVLFAAVEQVLPAADSRSYGMKFAFAANELTVSASSDNGAAMMVVPIRDVQGGTLPIGLNGCYVSDFLRQAGKAAVRFGGKDDTRATDWQVIGEEYRCVIMIMSI